MKKVEAVKITKDNHLHRVECEIPKDIEVDMEEMNRVKGNNMLLNICSELIKEFGANKDDHKKIRKDIQFPLYFKNSKSFNTFKVLGDNPKIIKHNTNKYVSTSIKITFFSSTCTFCYILTGTIGDKTKDNSNKFADKFWQLNDYLLNKDNYSFKQDQNKGFIGDVYIFEFNEKGSVIDIGYEPFVKICDHFKSQIGEEFGLYSLTTWGDIITYIIWVIIMILVIIYDPPKIN